MVITALALWVVVTAGKLDHDGDRRREPFRLRVASARGRRGHRRGGADGGPLGSGP